MLAEAEKLNPGPWVRHNRTAGLCAEKIARRCSDIDSEAAYILGLLHDIGRRAGIYDLRHIWLGYQFMEEQGFDDSAKICLTHSFPYQELLSYSGQNDCSPEEINFIKSCIENTHYDDYDRLIQLCDAISFPAGATYMEKRLVDVALRRGINDLTLPKWKAFFQIKEHFDQRADCNIYSLFDLII